MLHSFLASEGFPSATFHLNHLWDTANNSTDSLDIPPGSKGERIAGILRDFPDRRFILVGDSGQKDPEIYADLARQNASQVAAILIRDLKNEGPQAARFASCFDGLPVNCWQVFSDPDEIEFEIR